MGKTAILLIATLITIPLIAFNFDQPLTPQQSLLLKEVAFIMLGVAVYCFVVGELAGNVSQVDKLWSIVPVVYAWYVTVRAGMDPRMVLMSAVATVWGIRLTYNFSRHGGYSWKFWTGHEDYRWAHVRAKPELQGALRWKLFHLGFICLYQNALLLLIALPILMTVDAPRPIGAADYALAALFIALVVRNTPRVSSVAGCGNSRAIRTMPPSSRSGWCFSCSASPPPAASTGRSRAACC
jgi:steroid 5-alpha reductase family enzyme